MILLSAPNGHDLRPLPFYLAMEQWAARRFADEEVFFTWIVKPTVIIGRHQCLEAEVDVDYCRANEIDIVRRLSGGGCVYADPENLMVSYICPTHRPVPEVFATFAGKLAATLGRLGVEATVSGRNDILIDGKKVSGCAFYHTGTHAIVHSTLLFGCDPAAMSRAITPERSKLAARGVKSVASRITTIKQYDPELTIARFRAETAAMTDSEYLLTAGDEAEIHAIEAGYRTPERLNGRGLSGFTVRKSERIPDVGKVEAALRIERGIISEAAIQGDFLTGSTPVSELEKRLTGQRPESLSLDGINVPDIIVGLSNNRLISLLTE